MTHRELTAENYFDADGVEPFAELFGDAPVWEALRGIPAYLERHLRPNLDRLGCFAEPLARTVVLLNGEWITEGFTILGGDVSKGGHRVRIGDEVTGDAVVLYAGCVIWDQRVELAPGCVVEPGALVKGPTRIGSCTEIRQGAYIRGKCVIGSGCVVGHTTEMKSSIMLDGAKAGHFAYIGDSILGKGCNLGAGTKLANLKVTGTTVRIPLPGGPVDTGLRKLGAIIGDGVELGCNSVTNPGVLLGRGCLVLPATSIMPGCYRPGSRIPHEPA